MPDSAGAIFRVFLRLGLTSFGGPIAHLGYYRREFVERRRWLSESAYADLVALCQFLPGPASSPGGLRGGTVARRCGRRPRRLGGVHLALGHRAHGSSPWERARITGPRRPGRAPWAQGGGCRRRRPGGVGDGAGSLSRSCASRHRGAGHAASFSSPRRRWARSVPSRWAACSASGGAATQRDVHGRAAGDGVARNRLGPVSPRSSCCWSDSRSRSDSGRGMPPRCSRRSIVRARSSSGAVMSCSRSCRRRWCRRAG